MSDNNPTTKKRKANDGRATVPDDGRGGGLFSSWLGYFSWRRDDNAQPTCGAEKLTQKIDTMMQMMSRMEQRQLASMDSLERRCEKLEDKCSKLENELGDIKESQLRQFEYNSMLVKNQRWKYSTPVRSIQDWEEFGYGEAGAEYLLELSECLKVFTETIRGGEFPHHGNNIRGIDLEWEGDFILDYSASRRIRPYWIEFADALKQFNPAFGVLPDGCETYFELENVQLAGIIPGLLKDALMNKPFQRLSFVNNADVGVNEGMSVDSIMDIMDSNKHLRKLTIGNNRIELGHMEKIFSAVHHGSIVELDLDNCFENGLGGEIKTYLVTNGGLAKLKRLGLGSNGITSSTIVFLANFLARNPPLKELDLKNNSLSCDCVDLLATSLRSNTKLRLLQLYGNTISDSSDEEFRLVLHNDDSLNSIADSNHSCNVQGVGFHSWNMRGFRKNGAWHEAPASFNRARKIYNLLSKRNKSTSNVQYFGDTGVKLLPSILEAVQRYASVEHPDDQLLSGYCGRVEPLSIVYEVMRKWDKVFPFYTDGGDNDSN